MTEFGVATILGSVCFATCLIPAVAHLANYGLREPKPEITEEQVKQNEKLQRVFVREMFFIIIGLVAFYYFLAVGAITQLNLLLFLFLWFGYMFVFWKQLEPIPDQEAARKKNDDLQQPRNSVDGKDIANTNAAGDSEDEGLLKTDKKVEVDATDESKKPVKERLSDDENAEAVA